MTPWEKAERQLILLLAFMVISGIITVAVVTHLTGSEIEKCQNSGGIYIDSRCLYGVRETP